MEMESIRLFYSCCAMLLFLSLPAPVSLHYSHPVQTLIIHTTQITSHQATMGRTNKALLCLALCASVPSAAAGGILNGNFENGMAHWTGNGVSFDFQPTFGDNPTARNRGQPSNHEGDYWIGTWEKYDGITPGQNPGDGRGDDKTGFAVSDSFILDKPVLKFLIGGGCNLAQVGLSVHLASNDANIGAKTGNCHETMSYKWLDLTAHVGQEVYVKLYDFGTGGWGHINADDIKTVWDAQETCPASGVVVSVGGAPVAGVPVSAAALNEVVAGPVFSLSKLPPPMRDGAFHFANSLVPATTDIELSCCGSATACEFYVVSYNCGDCRSSGMNGGFPSVLPLAGFDAGSCSPWFTVNGAGPVEHPMVVHHKQVAAGDSVTVTTTKQGLFFAVFGDNKALGGPWCRRAAGPPLGNSCSAQCADLQ